MRHPLPHRVSLTSTQPLLVLLLLPVWLAFTPHVSLPAQTEATGETPAETSPEWVRSRLQTVESSPNLDQGQREQAAETYRQVLTELEALPSLAAKLQKHREDSESIASQTQELEAVRSALPDQATLDETAGLSIEQLDANVRQTQQTLEKARSRLAKLQDESKRRQASLLDVPKTIAGLQEESGRIGNQLAEAPADDVPRQLSDAAKLLLITRQQKIQLEIDALRQELAFYDGDDELLRLKIDVAQRQMTLLEQELSLWNDAAAARRQEIVQSQEQQAQTKATAAAPELANTAAGNLETIRQRQELASQIQTTSNRLAEVETMLNDWDTAYDQVYTQLAPQAEISESIGLDLRNRRRQLPDATQLHRESKTTRRRIFDIRFQQLAIDVELSRLSDLDDEANERLRQVTPPLTPERIEALKPEMHSLLADRRESLTRLNKDSKRYLDDLVRLNVKLDALVGLVERYQSFIDERVLWIRSTTPIGLYDASAVAEACSWFFSKANWQDMLHGLLASWRHPLLASVSCLVFVVFAVFLRYRGSLVGRLHETGERASSRTCRDFSVTLRAMALTLALAATWPLMLIWLSWILRASPSTVQIDLAQRIAGGLLGSAMVYAALAFWRQTTRAHGLAEAHFEWSDHVLRVVRRETRWLPWVLVPAVALYKTFDFSNNLLWDESISRLALIALSVMQVVFLGRMLSPRSGVVQEYLGRHRGGWADQLRYVWYLLILAVPVAFSVMALLGFVYTVSRLTDCLYLSIVFLSVLYVLLALSLRWILLNRRDLAIAQARERLAAAAASQDERTPSENHGGVTLEQERIDLTAVNQQTRRLLTSFTWFAVIIGMYLIWIDVLPALSQLNEIRIWRTDILIQQSAGATEATAASAVDAVSQPSAAVYQWITLGNLLGTILILTMMIVATRNIPGLLEIVVLQHLPLDASLRFAITTVTRYLIIIFGVSWALATLGFGWSRIQWLAAAISVGLGFGLQEIFANFVSGLILLFERPLRAGDIVTVGNVTGKVLQIKTRATTIQDWDRKELVVPNKEFITSQLLNWTLVDQVNRLVIPIGVAYGTDIAKARGILLNIAQNHPLVLKEPAPSATFDTFGDSALNLTLRLHLALMEHRMTVTHELHEEIHRSFATEGIEIPFPQRDLHLRTVASTF